MVDQAWAAVIGGDSWAGMLQNRNPVPEHLKCGVGGSTAREWAHTKPWMLAKMLQTGASVFVLSLGGNDMIKAAADEVITVREMVTVGFDLYRVYKKLAENFNYGLVLLYADPAQGRDPASAKGVARIRRVIESVAAVFPRIYTYDTDDVLGPEDFDVSKDPIHPTPAGIQKLYAALLDDIRLQCSR